ncbi:MAG: hypothetical protein KAH57_01980 [Thermoplasmata archaeon]|nr:hypothetical protein [Thermoplasmata archaeon]
MMVIIETGRTPCRACGIETEHQIILLKRPGQKEFFLGQATQCISCGNVVNLQEQWGELFDQEGR